MTDEQFALLSKAKESARAALLLNSQGYYDFAVSRAYYAMFYVAQALLLEEGKRFSSHSAVMSAFGRTFAKTGRVSPTFHRFLLDAEEHRLKSDYEVTSHASKDDATETISHAEQFVAMGERLLGPAPSESGKDG